MKLLFTRFNRSFIPTTTTTTRCLFSSDTLVKSLPGKAYTEASFYDIDRKHVLGPSWQLVTHESVLLKGSDNGPATYAADVVSGFPTIVVRSSKTGEINAYHNVCRHKAGPLEWSNTSGICSLNGLKCKYHGWTYSLDGKLKGVPGFGNSENAKFDKSKYSLWPMRVAVWKGLVFVQALPPSSSEGIPLSGTEADELFISENKGFCDRLDKAAQTAGGRSLSDFHFYKGATHTLNCNWKVYVENYLEGYHIPTIHPGLNKEVDINTYRVVVEDGYVEHLTETTKESAYDGVWLWHHPTLAINWYGPGLSLERIVPTGPHTTEIRYQYLFVKPPDQIGDDEKHAIDTSAEVTLEDIMICEAVQERLNGGGYLEPGFLSPRHENGVAYFQDKIRQIHNQHSSAEEKY